MRSAIFPWARLLGQAREIALDVGQKDRHAQGAEGSAKARVTVLPVPVAPVIKPWRLPMAWDANVPFPGAGP